MTEENDYAVRLIGFVNRVLEGLGVKDIEKIGGPKGVMDLIGRSLKAEGLVIGRYHGVGGGDEDGAARQRGVEGERPARPSGGPEAEGTGGHVGRGDAEGAENPD